MQLEAQIECPNCGGISLKGRENHAAYFNAEKDTWHCFRCGAKGTSKDLDMDNLHIIRSIEKQEFNAVVWDELEPLSPEARSYLLKRGIPNPDSFNLKYERKSHSIAIPTLDQKGNIQGIKYRFIAPIGKERFSAASGSKFGGYWLDGSLDKLLIVEGEFDAMAAKVVGFNGVVLALQTCTLSSESENRIRSFKNIFLALDNDESGQEGTEKIKQLVFKSNLNIINFPDKIKDLNQLLVEKGRDEAYRFLTEATKTKLQRDSLKIGDITQELVSFLSDRRNRVGDSTGWTSLDKILGGGLRPNEMSVINAFAKTGKTSFVTNLTHNIARLGKRIAVASFEMDPAKMLYPTLLSIAGETNLRSIEGSDNILEAVKLIQESCPYLNNLITLKRFGFTNWSEIEEWAKLMKQEHEIEYLVLDHAGFMVEKMTDAEDNQKLAKSIKELTNTLNIHILVVVQAPKTKDGLSIQTAYGGMAWGQNTDNFLILERDKEDETLLKVKLEAARYPGAFVSGTPIHLFYDRDTYTLKESSALSASYQAD